MFFNVLGLRLLSPIPATKELDAQRALFLILYDVWVDLYGKSFADNAVKAQKGWKGVYDYESAWNWALSFNAEQRASQFKEWVSRGKAQISLTPTPVAFTFRDDFDSPTLNPAWSWVREDKTHWSLSANPGSLRIMTQSKQGIFGTVNNQKNLLLTNAPAGNFEVVTRVAFIPQVNFNSAMLLVYADDDNFVVLRKMQCAGCGESGFELEMEAAGKYVLGRDVGAWKSVRGSPFFMKIVKDGTRYKGYYSMDGTQWTQVGEHTHDRLTDIKVGITATNQNNEDQPPINADFDYFCVTKLP